MTLSGVLNLDKPEGLTSREAVSRVARALGIRKAGHAGTLDPAATGVLLVCLGSATRLSSYLMGLPKTYEAVLRLGVCTDTQDAEGAVTRRGDVSGLTPEDIRAAFDGFVGEIQQIPPMYSAVKHRGVALHKLARKGETVARAPRPVRIHRLDIRDISLPLVAFTVTCSKGTYVRTLCEDIGMALSAGGHLRSLRRTAVGDFRVEDACPIERVQPSRVLPPGEALAFLPAVAVTGPREGALLMNGHRLPMASFVGAAEIGDGTRVRLYHPDHGFVGVGRCAYPDMKVEMLMPAAPGPERKGGEAEEMTGDAEKGFHPAGRTASG